MQIYILRHGISEDPKPGATDADRALTSEGKKKLRTVLKVAHRADVSPSLILTSPFRRALETAEIAAEELGYREELVHTRALIPSSDPQSVWDEVRAHKQADEMMLVGHEPLFSQLVAFLLGAPELHVDVKKGSLIRIDVAQFGPRPHGVLRWILTPKLAAAE
jgi:phosphohistidine phosphatase